MVGPGWTTGKRRDTGPAGSPSSRGGATRHQGPRLDSNLFLSNLRFQKEASHRRCALEDLNREIPRMAVAYDKALAKDQGMSH